MNEILESIWEDINERLFESRLLPLRAIEWGPIGGQQGVDAHGWFLPLPRYIFIDERFSVEKDALRAADQTARQKLDISYYLMIHEMIHQALDQNNMPSADHGKSFLEEAQRIAKLLDEPQPTAEDVARFPMRSLIPNMWEIISKAEAETDDQPGEPSEDD